jgi:hypothetical protein
MYGSHFSVILLPIYKALFSTMEQLAASVAGERARRTLPVLRVACA